MDRGDEKIGAILGGYRRTFEQNRRSVQPFRLRQQSLLLSRLTFVVARGLVSIERSFGGSQREGVSVMATPLLSVDSEWLLLRAEQCRVLGSGFKDAETREKMLGLATYYRELAATIERPETSVKNRHWGAA